MKFSRRRFAGMLAAVCGPLVGSPLRNILPTEKVDWNLFTGQQAAQFDILQPWHAEALGYTIGSNGTVLLASHQKKPDLDRSLEAELPQLMHLPWSEFRDTRKWHQLDSIKVIESNMQAPFFEEHCQACYGTGLDITKPYSWQVTDRDPAITGNPFVQRDKRFSGIDCSQCGGHGSIEDSKVSRVYRLSDYEFAKCMVDRFWTVADSIKVKVLMVDAVQPGRLAVPVMLVDAGDHIGMVAGAPQGVGGFVNATKWRRYDGKF